jgi:ribosomal protein L11 methyltransferase
MNQHYITVQITCPSDLVDLLIAELAECNYDGFLETDQGFETYRPADDFDETELQRVLDWYRPQAKISYTTQTVAEQNWNAEWEKNFEPIVVADQCRVRASFHATEPAYPYDIVINPKMSFGTGHHATTYLMLREQLAIDHQRKRVMDAGCGTGILSIMAHQRGAAHVLAFDIDSWAVENSQENFELNGADTIQLFQGTVSDVDEQTPFDIILANINRNVLLDEMAQYVRHLAPGGTLLLSGFYEEDLPLLQEAATAQGLIEVRADYRDQWAVLRLRKPEE